MERKEPTFSGLQADHEEAPAAAAPEKRKPSPKAKAPQVGSKNSAPSNQSAPVNQSTSSNQSAPGRASPAPAASSSSPVGIFALILSLVALGGAGYLFWSLTETQKQLADANGRILELQQALQLSGDESTQSVAALQANLKKQQGDVAALRAELKESNHEIRKLWDTRNVNKKAIAANKKGLESTSAKVKALPGEVKKAREQLTAQQKQVSALKSDARQALETATLLSASIEQQQQSLRELVDSGTQAENRLVDLTARMKANEEAIRSIDAFRKNTNSELWKLKQSLQPAAPRQ